MANGEYFGTKKEWLRLEAPLLEVDPVIEQFAKENGLSVGKNHKDWPERSLIWGNEVRCLIQLYLASEEALTFNLWLCASQDRDGKRYWKQETPIKAKPVSEFKDQLPALLREGRDKLISWSQNPSTMEFATDIG